MYGAPLCLPEEFLDSVDLPPREFLDRIQSALHGLTLPPPHPFSARVPTALASAEYVFVCKDTSIQPLSQLYCGPYRVLTHQDKFACWKLVPSKILFPFIDSSLFLDLSLVFNSLLGVVGPLPPPWFLRLWFRILKSFWGLSAWICSIFPEMW